MVIPKGWLLVNLSQLGLFGELKNGFAFKSSDYQSSGIPLIKIGNFKNCKVDVSNANYLPENFLEKHSNFLVSKNDLLIAMSGATTGKIAVVKATDLPAFLNQRVGNLGALNKSLVYESYLPYLEIQIKKELMALAPGSAMPNISKLVIERLPILLPPLEEQRRIVARVEELAGKIKEARSLRQQTLEETEALVASFLHKVFVDEENTWTQLDVGSVAEIIDPNPSHRMPHYVEKGIPFISTVDFEGSETIRRKAVKCVTEETYKEQLERCLFTVGDILYSRIGTIGQARILTEIWQFALSHVLVVVKPNKDIVLPRFLLWYLRSDSIITQAASATRSIGVPDLGIKRIRGFHIPVPPLPEQRRIVAYLDNLQAKVDEMKRLREQALKELDAMLPSILDKAFKGEL